MNQANSQHMNVFTVEEYGPENDRKKAWTKVGAALPHKSGEGFSIDLRAFPVDGRLVVLPPTEAPEAPAPQSKAWAPTPSANGSRNCR